MSKRNAYGNVAELKPCDISSTLPGNQVAQDAFNMTVRDVYSNMGFSLFQLTVGKVAVRNRHAY